DAVEAETTKPFRHTVRRSVESSAIGSREPQLVRVARRGAKSQAVRAEPGSDREHVKRVADQVVQETTKRISKIR
ncbi:MAG: hypothetical protein K1X38_16750, partial [Microthrixaceae bacterium]|nr:hypothetical protein [Microthrixaceae bacterium]